MLPSKVLSSSLHYHQPKKLTIRTSAAALVDGVIIFQEKARIPKLIVANGTGKQQAKAVGDDVPRLLGGGTGDGPHPV